MKFDFSNRWVQILASIAAFGIGYYVFGLLEKLF